MAAPGYWERQIGTKDPAEALGTMLYLLIKGGSEPRKEFAKKAQEEADKLEQEREMYKLNKQIAEAQYKLLLFHAKKEVDVDIAQKKFWNMPPDKMFENSHTDPPITTPYGTAGGGTISLPGGLGAIAQPNPPNRRGPMFSPITPHEGPPRPLTLPSISIPQTTLPFEQSQSPTRRPAPLGVTPQLSPSTRMLSQEAILAARKAGIDPRTLGFPMPEDIAKERRTAQLEKERSARSLRDRLTVEDIKFKHSQDLNQEDPEVAEAEKRKKIADAEKAEADLGILLAAQDDPGILAEVIGATLHLSPELIPKLAKLKPQGILSFVNMYGADASRQLSQELAKLSMKREEREARHQQWTEEQAWREYVAAEKWRQYQAAHGIRNDERDAQMEAARIALEQKKTDIAQERLELLKREHPDMLDFVVTQGTRTDGTPYRSRTIRGKLPAGREVPNREAGITYLMKRGKLTRPKAAALWDHQFGRGR